MTLITGYTAESFKAFLYAEMGSRMAAAFGFTPESPELDTVLEDVELAFGANIEDIGPDDLLKVRAVGRCFLWRYLASYYSSDYDANEGGVTLSRSSLREHCAANTERDCAIAFKLAPDQMNPTQREEMVIEEVKRRYVPKRFQEALL